MTLKKNQESCKWGYASIIEKCANFPNHTQSVERLIKRVTEAGQHVATEDRRDGVVLAQLEACRMLPVYETKKDLVKLTEYANTYKKPRRDGAGTSS